jgi:hypothetical protein
LARETTAEAITVLDSQFSWLRRAERRHSRPETDFTPGKTVSIESFKSEHGVRIIPSVPEAWEISR